MSFSFTESLRLTWPPLAKRQHVSSKTMELDTTFDPNPFHTPLKLNFQKNTIETQFPESRPSKITSTANTVTRPIACKITMDHQSHSQDEKILLFLQKQFPHTEIRHGLSDSWPYGRVFVTSSGFHGEFFTRHNDSLTPIPRKWLSQRTTNDAKDHSRTYVHSFTQRTLLDYINIVFFTILCY